MEGNTYNILETAHLIRFGQEVPGKDRKEAVMILNHKEAIQYMVEHLADIAISPERHTQYSRSARRWTSD